MTSWIAAHRIMSLCNATQCASCAAAVWLPDLMRLGSTLPSAQTAECSDLQVQCLENGPLGDKPGASRLHQYLVPQHGMSSPLKCFLEFPRV